MAAGTTLDDGWTPRRHPAGGWRDLRPGAAGTIWIVAAPRGDGTYTVEAGMSRRTRTAQRRSAAALARCRTAAARR